MNSFQVTFEAALPAACLQLGVEPDVVRFFALDDQPGDLRQLGRRRGLEAGVEHKQFGAGPFDSGNQRLQPGVDVGHVDLHYQPLRARMIRRTQPGVCPTWNLPQNRHLYGVMSPPNVLAVPIAAARAAW